jgi:lipid A 3-O-deacylase PagL
VNLFEGFSFDVGYRYQHISDAGLTERNRGINSHLPYIGFTHFF